MVALAIVLALFAMLLGLVLLSAAAWLRAEDALRSLRALSRRLGEVEKRVGMARPGAEPAGPAEAQPGPAPETSLEERIALAWFARIGAGILLVGAGVFFLQGTAGGISRAGRVLAGGLFGLAALAFAEAIRSRARPLYVHAVLGIGVAVLLFSAFASHGLYGIASPRAAFAAVLAVAALAAALSVRHRAGIALSLAAAGGLLAPELLWRDAPAAGLLLYVLVLSGAAFWVASRAGLGFAPWLALLGSFALLAAWRVRAFDPGPSGPHRALADRLVPLGFAAAFTVEWLLVHARARRPGRERLRPLAFLVAALVLSHALFAALLFDRPALLGLAFAVLAILGVRLLGREQRPVLLLAPLLVSSLALAGAVHPGAPPAATLAALAAWGAVYAAGFLRPGAAPLALSGVAGASFLVLAGELLAPHRPRAFGLVAAAWALAYAWLAMARRSPVLLASTAAVSFLGLAGAAAPIGAAGDPVLLAIGGAWALVYLGGLAWRIWREAGAPEWTHLATAAAASAGLILLGLALTPPSSGWARAALAAAAAAAHAALGARMRARAPSRGAACAALSVAFLATAAALLLPGAGSTLAWAALATALVGAGFARRSRLVRSLGLGLFAATVAKLALWDVWTLPRAWQVGVLLAVGALLLAASYLYARHGARLVELLREGRE
jgi:hypothetical protein